MKKYRLSIITENQKLSIKADVLANLIKMELGITSDPEIGRYEKFSNSYKIEFSGVFMPESDCISEAVELTSRIASPWLVYYFRENGELELILNKTDRTRYGRQEFNVIRWANLETE